MSYLGVYKMGNKKLTIYNPLGYFKFRLENYPLSNLLSLSDSGYPKIFALGIYDPRFGSVVCDIGINKDYVNLLIAHEEGHSRGLKHVKIWKIGYMMHPWGLLRGWK